MRSELRRERQYLHLLIAEICLPFNNLPPIQPRFFLRLMINDAVLDVTGNMYAWDLSAFSTNRDFTGLADQLQALMPSCGVGSPEDQS